MIIIENKEQRNHNNNLLDNSNVMAYVEVRHYGRREAIKTFLQTMERLETIHM